MKQDVIGIRLARNTPVLFVDGNGWMPGSGDAVVIELSDDEKELDAVVVIGAGQLLHASIGDLAGRVLKVF